MGIRALERRKVKLLLTCVVIGVLIPVVYVSYFCPEKGCISKSGNAGSHTPELSSNAKDVLYKQIQVGGESNPDSTAGVIRNAGVAPPDRHPLQVSTHVVE
jgi:hypothetical protein